MVATSEQLKWSKAKTSPREHGCVHWKSFLGNLHDKTEEMPDFVGVSWLWTTRIPKKKYVALMVGLTYRVSSLGTEQWINESIIIEYIIRFDVYTMIHNQQPMFFSKNPSSHGLKYLFLNHRFPLIGFSPRSLSFFSWKLVHFTIHCKVCLPAIGWLFMVNV